MKKMKKPICGAMKMGAEPVKKDVVPAKQEMFGKKEKHKKHKWSIGLIGFSGFFGVHHRIEEVF